jgi:hypothetical protein
MEFDISVVLAIVTAYGATVTKLVDFVRNTIGKKQDGSERSIPRWVWQLCGFAFGVGVAYAFGVNAFSGSGGRSWPETVLTGLAIGAAGSGYHELFDALSGVAKAKHSDSEEAQARLGRAALADANPSTVPNNPNG